MLNRVVGCISGLCVFAVLFSSGPSDAFDVPQTETKVMRSMPHFITPGLYVEPSLDTERAIDSSAKGIRAWRPFAQDMDRWEIRWDTRNNRPNLIMGSGIDLLGQKHSHANLDTVAEIVRAFLVDRSDLLGLDGINYSLDREHSVYFAPKDYWSVQFQQTHNGIPIEDAYVYARINHGRIVQFGTYRIAPVTISTKAQISGFGAFSILLDAMGVDVPVSRMLNAGQLKLYPMAVAGDKAPSAYQGKIGQGYTHILAWEFSFQLAGSDDLLRAIVSADGKVLELVNQKRFAEARVSGKVFPTTNAEPLMEVNFPSARVTNNSNKVTDEEGYYDYEGATATCKMDGPHIRINDTCGAINLSDSADGNLDFSGVNGTDCDTPGVGGPGNTNASRSAYYHLTKINRKAARFLPNNTWINNTNLRANVNLNQTCNAYWSGFAVNFFKSGGGCSNTGEIAAVFLHEWGHGLDANTGGAAREAGSGEALGDTFAFLETRDGCIGKNFIPGKPCANCREDCTGVRDVAAFGIDGISDVARPDTVASDTGINCDRWACPYRQGFSPYMGPMGYEGHCEAIIAGAANWDLTQMLVKAYGEDQGYAAMDEIWYGSLVPAKSAYQLASGGQCNPQAEVDGCGSSNWYTVFLSVDDDDGDLSNGTPNACHIWEAFNAHGIACGEKPECSGGCTPYPVADAGDDVVINLGQSVVLGNEALPDHTYFWSPGGQTSAQIEVAPEVTTTYTLTATTSCGSATDQVTVTVIDGENNPPIADAGKDQTVKMGVRVTLDATGSFDPDGDSLSLLWTQTAGPEVELSDETAWQPTFVAPSVDQNQTLTFVLVVSDAQYDSEPDSVDITVEASSFECITAVNNEHVKAGRAELCGWFSLRACAVGSGDNLGWRWATSSVEETALGYWESVSSCASLQQPDRLWGKGGSLVLKRGNIVRIRK